MGRAIGRFGFRLHLSELPVLIPDADIEGRRPGALCLLSAPAEVQPGLARIADVHFLSLGLL